jgi:nitrogen fixation NifU-like protein
MDIYAENIIDHYKHPHKKERLPSPTVSHKEKNASCGDTLTIDLSIENDTVTAVGWTGEGCAISQASMSILSDELMGKPVSSLDGLKAEDIKTLLNVPIGARRMKCALLCLHALKNALHAHRKEPAQGWQETVAS